MQKYFDIFRKHICKLFSIREKKYENILEHFPLQSEAWKVVFLLFFCYFDNFSASFP